SGSALALDGDTIVVDGYHIRLHGLDAEEMNETHGPDARQAMLGLIRGHMVICLLTGDRSYNRYVATCYIGQLDLAEAIVASGHALDCAHYSHGKYRRFEPVGIRLRLQQKPYC